jgi:hypothetical protein
VSLTPAAADAGGRAAELNPLGGEEQLRLITISSRIYIGFQILWL